MRILVGSVEIYNENIGWVLSICDLPLDCSNDYGEVCLTGPRDGGWFELHIKNVRPINSSFKSEVCT